MSWLTIIDGDSDRYRSDMEIVVVVDLPLSAGRCLIII